MFKENSLFPMFRLISFCVAIVLILLLATSYGYGQNKYSITAKVTDLTGTAISSGEVQLLMAKDSALVKYSGFVNGEFSLQGINEGSYLIRISCVGFYDEITNLVLNQNANVVIKLRENQKVLKEVQITAPKGIFSNKMGNMKVEIENTILSKMADLVSLLTKLPSVQLSSDGESINIIGRGEPLIYLDNQKITLNELNSLSTNDIKSIEIINNPSAKYEAEGRTVLLITRSKNRTDGFKAVISETASFKRFFQNRSGINLNYKKDKLELRTNVQYNYLNLWESNSNAFGIPDKGISSDYNVLSIGLRKQVVIGGGLYYQVNENDYLSFNVSNRFQNEDFINTANSYIRQPASADQVITENKNASKRPLFNSSINYNKKFKESNGQLFLGGQYSRGAQDLNSGIYNNYNNTQNILTQDRMQGYHTNIVSGRADYEQPFGNNIKWETGAAFSSAGSNSFIDMLNHNPFNQTASDFKYDEQIYGAYTQLSGKTAALSYSAGLRLEDTHVRGEGDNTGLAVKKDYVNFFPKAGIELTLTENKSLAFNYARSITRPNYASASQITTYINPFFEWANNINIDPTIKDELSATFQLNQGSLGLTYYRLKNPVYYSIEYNDQLNRLRMVNINYALETGVNLVLTQPFKYRFLTSTNVLTGVFSEVKDPQAVLNKSKPYVYLYSNNQFALPHDYTLMISGWGYTKRVEGLFERNAMYAIDFGLSKTFFKKLSCTVSYNSLLSTKQATENFTINHISSRGIYYLDVREFSIGVKYSIGGIKDSKYKSKAVDDNINRL